MPTFAGRPCCCAAGPAAANRWTRSCRKRSVWAAWRAGAHLRLEPFDVQLAAGVVLHKGGLAEVATGEGKTLVAILPAALNALQGKGVHVTTVNDYLARRDSELTAPVHAALGLTVGMLQSKASDDARTAAYKADITYGTSSEFGFDFLRDRLKVKSQGTQGTPFWMPWTAGRSLRAAARSQSPARPSLRPGRRGGQRLRR